MVLASANIEVARATSFWRSGGCLANRALQVELQINVGFYYGTNPTRQRGKGPNALLPLWRVGLVSAKNPKLPLYACRRNCGANQPPTRESSPKTLLSARAAR
jgi:hypothetical protein